MNHTIKTGKLFIICSLLLCMAASCHKKEKGKEEQLSMQEYSDADTSGLTTSNQFASSVSDVLLTGMDKVRLLAIYKIKPGADRNIERYEGTTYSYYEDMSQYEDSYKYYMPGMDLIYGYNLVNIGHYDLEKDTLTYFFQSPVLVRTLYFPGVKRDSLLQKPITRNYFLVSVYDEDSNNDSVINKKDLRRFYHFDQNNTKKTQLIPADYSVVRSTYDYKTDIMYIYARHDANKNGTPDRTEPIAIYWFRLSDPTVVKRMV